MATTLPLIRTSERKDFKRCPWLWNESWNKQLTTRRAPTWSWFGTAVHAGLEARYKPGKKRGKLKKVLEAFEESVADQTGRIWTAGGELEEDQVVEAKDLGIAMLKGYVEHYGDEPEIDVIHSEQTFQIDVPHPFKKGETLAVYAGTWDSLWRIDGRFWLVDHKTRKAFPSNWDFYDIDDQAGSYLWVAPEVLEHMGVLTKKELKKLDGLIFNALRKHLPDTRQRDAEGYAVNKPVKADYEAALSPFMDLPTRLPTIAVLQGWADERNIKVLGERSKVQPSPLFHRQAVTRSIQERAQMGQRVQAEALWMDQVRTGQLPVIKTPGEDCIRCQLFDYCQADEHDKEEGQELGRHLLRSRDPYVDHRAMMEKNGVEVKNRKK